MTAPQDTAVRLRRLLAVLAWLAQVGEAPIEEAAARFDLTPEALVTELEMAACCGVPPYTPDQLMEIIVTDTTVSARVGNSMARPRRLSPSEGFALATSARGLLAVSGSDDNGALSRALAKLERALGGDSIDVELDTPVFLPQVREAVETGGRLSVSYYSASTDRVTDRVIAPIRVFASQGHWYTDAWCSTAGDVRRFRVDRINSAVVAEGSDGLSDAPPPVGGAEEWSASPDGVDSRGPDAGAGRPGGLEPFIPGPDGRRVRLSLDPTTAWLVESIPSAGEPGDVDGRVELELVVGGEAWLERLLLRLGPEARVLDPPEFRSLGAEAAARILVRYADSQLSGV